MDNISGMHERRVVKRDSTETLITLAANQELQRQAEARKAKFWGRVRKIFSGDKS